MTESPITLEQALAWLERQRNTLDRDPYGVTRYGEWLLENHQLGALRNDVWAFLEQLGLASIELGKYALAELCIERLQERFPTSKRVVALQGSLLESRGLFDQAIKLYESILVHEPSNILLNKRRIACLKSQPNGLGPATEALAKFVDVFPTDCESWLELAALYQAQNNQALFALEELLLLSPQNGYYLLEYAETLYTAGEFAKAYKIYLRILELGNGNLAPNSADYEDRTRGPWVRTLWGLKMCTAQMLGSPPKGKSSDDQVVAKDVQAIDELVTKLLLTSVYAPGPQEPPASTRAAARAVLSA